MTGYHPVPSAPRGRLERITSSLRELARLGPTQVAAQVAHSIRGPGREPARTTVPSMTVEVPPTLLGPSPEGHVEPMGAVALCGAAPFDPLVGGWDVVGDPSWAHALHAHGWLTRATPSRAVATIRSWIDTHPRGSGWEPYATSLRLLSWIGWLAQSSTFVETIAGSMAAQSEHLRRNVETHLEGHHVWTNLAAIAATSLVLRGPEAPPVEPSIVRFASCVAQQLDRDGVHVQRTPSFHCLLAEQLAIVTDLAWTRGLPHANALRAQLGRMLAALPSFTHPDGDVALFGDSRRGAGANPASLCKRAGMDLALHGAADAPHAGFARRTFGPWTLLFNRGHAPPFAGHVHADAASFELSLEDERVIVDAGAGSFTPGNDRSYARSTRAHNTVTVGADHPDQHELWDAHRMGARARVFPGTWGPDAIAAEVVGHRSPASHHRTIEGDATSIRISDRVAPNAPAVARFHLPATMRLIPQGSGVRVETPHGNAFTIATSSGPLRIEPAAGWHALGVRAPRLCLAVEIQPAGSTVTFRL